MIVPTGSHSRPNQQKIKHTSSNQDWKRKQQPNTRRDEMVHQPMEIEPWNATVSRSRENRGTPRGGGSARHLLRPGVRYTPSS
jgi:hypothetical protein